MSSSKRGKRRKKSKTSLERYADKRDQSKNDDATRVDFFFLLLGMITSLMTFLLVFSVFTTPPKTSAALEAAKSGNATKEVNATDDSEFDEVLESSDATQLTNILNGLNASVAGETREGSIKQHQRRIEVSNRLLTKKLDDKQSKLAITSKIKALTTVYGLGWVLREGVPNVAESLRDASTSYATSADPEIKKLAKLSLFKVNSFEMAKEDNKLSVDSLVTEMCGLLKDYPNDDTVLATLDTIVQFFQKRLEPSVGFEIAQGLQARESEFVDSPKVVQMIRDITDDTTLSNANYTQLFEDRWVNGRSGQQKLLEKSLELVAEPTAGTLLIKVVNNVAHWFEQDDQYESAAAIYQKIMASADTYQNPKVTEIAKVIAKDGIARSKIIGEKIDLTGLLLNGEQHPVEELEGKVSLVVFWSMFSNKSSETLLSLSVSSQKWKERGIKIVAVNIDDSIELEKVTEITTPIKNVVFLFGDPKDNFSNNIYNQCPSEVVPRLMLVQRDGRVADINVPFEEVDTQLTFIDRE